MAEEHWSALPERFRVSGGNPDHLITPFERDFLISLQLNHLHVMFLLRRLLLDRLSEPDGPLIEIAQRMLALVVEAILTRDELANSGTKLSWKVSCRQSLQSYHNSLTPPRSPTTDFQPLVWSCWHWQDST